MEDWTEDMETSMRGNVQLVFSSLMEASSENRPWWRCEGSLMMVVARDE